MFSSLKYSNDYLKVNAYPSFGIKFGVNFDLFLGDIFCVDYTLEFEIAAGFLSTTILVNTFSSTVR